MNKGDRFSNAFLLFAVKCRIYRFQPTVPQWNENMKLRRLLGECCPQYSSKLEELKYQKAQKILMQLRSETNTILTVLSWSRPTQKQLDNAPVVDVSAVGEEEIRHGRMNPDKFKKLTKEQRDSWIDFHEKLLGVAQQVVKDTEARIQTLNSFREVLSLIVEPMETFSKHGFVNQQRVMSLRERYINFAQSVKSEGRIRVRYLRILQDSHNRELFLKWDEQVQREFNNADRRVEALDEFLSIARSIVTEIERDLPRYFSTVSFNEQRKTFAIVKSKVDILKHRLKHSEDQANSWAERAKTAAFENQPDKASEAERRRQIFETSVHLYKECSGMLNELCEQLKTGLQTKGEKSASAV